MAVLGQFRDLDAPDRFVWLRGFPDMEQRTRSLAAFYGGPVWHEHGKDANSTMIDFSDVLLLRPAWAGSGIRAAGRTRAAGAAHVTCPGLTVVSVLHLAERASEALLRFCREVLTPGIEGHGAGVLGWYVTEEAPNGYPRLPVREGEHVLVGVAAFEDAAAFEAFAHGETWNGEIRPGLSKWLIRPAEHHRLVPTARSAIHLCERERAGVPGRSALSR